MNDRLRGTVRSKGKEPRGRGEEGRRGERVGVKKEKGGGGEDTRAEKTITELSSPAKIPHLVSKCCKVRTPITSVNSAKPSHPPHLLYTNKPKINIWETSRAYAGLKSETSKKSGA